MKEDNLNKTIQLRHMLHQHPELSMREEQTIKILMRFLEEHTDLTVFSEDGWFYAVKPGTESGKKIAFRADMDALPIEESPAFPYASCHKGVSHKCGHDGHCAVLCGLALELSQKETDNTIFLIFQPGEETGQGARICKDLIRKESISEIFSFHNLPGYPQGTILYREGLTQPASEGIRIIFTGRTAHAADPEKGRNPAEALAETVLYSQEVCRNRSEFLLLCTVAGIRSGDGDFGISPGSGELCLTIRAEREEDMICLEQDLLDFAKKQAAEKGLDIDYRIADRFPETRNHEASLRRVLHAAEALRFPVQNMTELWRASEDFGHYLKECRGAMFYIGTGEDHPDLHTPEYDFNDEILSVGVDMFSALAGLSDR